MSIYVRAHYQGHRVYYALVATWKEDGKTRQRHLKYLGRQRPTTDEVERLKGEYEAKLPLSIRERFRKWHK